MSFRFRLTFFSTNWVLRRKGIGLVSLSLWLNAPVTKGEVSVLSNPCSSGSKALPTPPKVGQGKELQTLQEETQKDREVRSLDF